MLVRGAFRVSISFSVGIEKVVEYTASTVIANLSGQTSKKTEQVLVLLGRAKLVYSGKRADPQPSAVITT